MRELIIKYRFIASEIARLKEKIDSIYCSAASAKIKIITDMPMAPGFSGGGLENTFIQIEEVVDQIHALEMELDRCAAEINIMLDKARIMGASREVFWYKEVQNKKWHEVSRLMCKSVRQVQRIYKKTIYMSLLL